MPTAFHCAAVARLIRSEIERVGAGTVPRVLLTGPSLPGWYCCATPSPHVAWRTSAINQGSAKL
jgi:hypothetical protein